MRIERFVLIAPLLLGCATEPDALGGRIDASPVGDTATIGFTNVAGTGYYTHVVARDSLSWKVVWSTAFSGQSPQPAQPFVDFNEHMVLMAVTSGAPGTDIGVDSIVHYERGARAFISVCFGRGQAAEVVLPARFVRLSPVAPLDLRTRHTGLCPL